MKLTIFDLENKNKGDIELPKQFSEEIREDLIARAVRTIETNNRQRYGASPRAGLRVSADVSRRRGKYRGSYGLGISRVPRKIMSRRGTRMNWQGAEVPGTVGGRKAHPPKADKIWSAKINKKERRKAIRSALAASIVKEIVEKRGHRVPENYPFIIDDSVEGIEKASVIVKVLNTMGFKEELIRVKEKKVRSGKGKNRGRKYKKKTGPVIVVSKDCKLLAATGSVPGVEAVVVNNLNAKILAPGTMAGRMTIFTKSAIEKMGAEKLFM